MIHTFDFISFVWKSEEQSNTLIHNMAEQKETKIVIDVYALEFDFKRQTVKIYCNDAKYLFRNKIITVEMSFEYLIKLIHHQYDFEYKII